MSSNVITIRKGEEPLELYDLDSIEVNREALKHVSKELCEEYMIFPYDVEGRDLFLVSYRDLSKEEIKYLSFLVRKNIKLTLGRKEQITSYINIFYEETYRKALMNNFVKNEDRVKEDKGIEVQGPIVFLVDSILKEGILKEASDIHMEPIREKVRIRYRVDGVLIKATTEIPRSIYPNIITRLKVMAHMDISSRYQVQDGEFSLKIHGENYDFRVSILPTIYGEKFVLRILKENSRLLALKNLGFKEEDYKLLENILKLKQGLIIITGPTGSGKSSTLYAMIRELNRETRNIITVEKPVECTIEGINQVAIGAKGNLQYSQILKAALRQDPDVIMVGEIIDEETAEIAVRASLTGHLVLTTLHTNDASSTLNRLMDMGIQRELLNNSLLLVIAQRLTRIICEECKTSYEPTPEEVRILQVKRKSYPIYKGAGCKKCNGTGYKGRIIAYELMVMGDGIKDAMKTMDYKTIKSSAINNGMVTLEEYIKALVKNGVTTAEEYCGNLQGYNIKRALGTNYEV